MSGTGAQYPALDGIESMQTVYDRMLLERTESASSYNNMQSARSSSSPFFKSDAKSNPARPDLIVVYIGGNDQSALSSSDKEITPEAMGDKLSEAFTNLLQKNS